MKAYGIPRDRDLMHPDCADLHNFSLKSSVGHLPAKNGEYKSHWHNSEAKRRKRRTFKKKERRVAKSALTASVERWALETK